MSATENRIADQIADRRLAKAKGIASYLKGTFLNTVEHCTPEERQAIAVKANMNATEPPSQQSWDLVVTILRGV